MPVIADQYSLSNRELTELIIKQAGVHEGKWVLSITFAFGASNMGPSESELLPAAFAGVQRIGIARAVEGTPPPLIVDAAEVNPA